MDFLGMGLDPAAGSGAGDGATESDREGMKPRKRRPNYAASLAKRGSVPIRDETGRFIGVRPKTAAERAAKAASGTGGIFKSAAVEVLREEKRLMSTGDIAKLALRRNLIKCQGKTPEATMASALYTDVKRKEGRSIFIRPHEGLFGLREWADKGLVFKDPMEDEDGPILLDEHGQPMVQDGSAGGEGSEAGLDAQGYEASDGESEEGGYADPYWDYMALPGARPRSAPAPFKLEEQAEAATPMQAPPLRPTQASPQEAQARAAERGAGAAAPGAGSDDEHSNFELLLNAADALRGDEPSTAGTREPGDATMDDAGTGSRPASAARRRAGKRGEGVKFSRPHPLQVATPEPDSRIGGRAKRPRLSFNLPHHASFPSVHQGRRVEDFVLYGQGAVGPRPVQQPGAEGPGLAGSSINLLNLPFQEIEDATSGALGGPDEVPADADTATLDDVDVTRPAGLAARAAHQAVQQRRVTVLSDATNRQEQSRQQPSMTRERLHDLEGHLLLLETSYGPTNPKVGKAWMCLAMVYAANKAPACQQMAEQALVRCWETLALNHGAVTAEDVPATTLSSFTYLLDKIQGPGGAAAAAGTPAANGIGPAGPHGPSVATPQQQLAGAEQAGETAPQQLQAAAVAPEHLASLQQRHSGTLRM